MLFDRQRWWLFLRSAHRTRSHQQSTKLTPPNPAPPPLSQLTAVTERQCLWGSQVSNSAPLWKTSHLHQTLPLSLLFSARVVACFSREFSALVIIGTNRQGLRLGPEKVVSCYEGKTALWANLNLTEWGRAVAAEPPFSYNMHTCFSLSLSCRWSTFAMRGLSMNLFLWDDAVWVFTCAMPTSGPGACLLELLLSLTERKGRMF